jgi:hypothetical protein
MTDNTIGDRHLGADSGQVDAWIRPNPKLDVAGIREYALTFDGYAYAAQQKFNLAKLANEHRLQFSKTGSWKGSFIELRCCLFFEQRRLFWMEQSPDSQTTEDEAALRALNAALCEQWSLEWPGR